MKVSDVLLQDTFHFVDRHRLETSMAQAATALLAFISSVKQQSLTKALDEYGILERERGLLDDLVIPDAVWAAILTQHPSLQAFPFGRWTENAIKKTAVSVFLKDGEVSTWTPDDVLLRFLSHYFFELCINQFRRSDAQAGLAKGFRYNFAGKKRVAPLAAESSLRQFLLHQCEEKAGKSLPWLKTYLERNHLQIKKREQRLGKPFVNVAVGAKLPSNLYDRYEVDEDLQRLMLHTKSSNTSFHIYGDSSHVFDGLEHCLGIRPHSLVRDLLDLGAITYMADIHIQRVHHLGRRLGILIPVRHPEIWRGAQDKLARAVSFLGRDSVSFSFTEQKERLQPVDAFSVASDDRCICLFSGGLDSTAGALWILHKGLKPIFISHSASPRLAGMQKQLIEQLKKRFKQEIHHVGFFVGRSRVRKRVWHRLPSPPATPVPQHLRSFLFLTLATGIALEEGIDTVYVFENGPVALNPQFSEARVNTRTAHPSFLARFSELIQAVFSVEIQYVNPFLYHTKGEVARQFLEYDMPDLLADTTSCWAWCRIPLMAKQKGRTGFQGVHCGACLPCILRRVAVDNAGLQEWDTTYLMDIFTLYPKIQEKDIIALEDYLRYCQFVLGHTGPTSTELLELTPDFSVYERSVDCDALVDMYQRHAHEVHGSCFQRSQPMAKRWSFKYKE